MEILYRGDGKGLKVCVLVRVFVPGYQQALWTFHSSRTMGYERVRIAITLTKSVDDCGDQS